jgi:hypothetical protein
MYNHRLYDYLHTVGATTNIGSVSIHLWCYYPNAIYQMWSQFKHKIERFETIYQMWSQFKHKIERFEII